jgi:predicted nucleotidyltransferase
MITEKDKDTIETISRAYHVKRVLLFGSSMDPMKESHDIDIGVEGVAPEDFFKYYGDLMLKLSKPVDLVDLSEPSKFVQLILQEGVPLYG